MLFNVVYICRRKTLIFNTMKTKEKKIIKQTLENCLTNYEAIEKEQKVSHAYLAGYLKGVINVIILQLSEEKN
jgi:hypothetical protein